MAVGWTRNGGVQDQIDASVKDGVKLARSRLPEGEGATHCEECEAVIPVARRKAIPGVRLCVSSRNTKKGIPVTQANAFGMEYGGLLTLFYPQKNGDRVVLSQFRADKTQNQLFSDSF